METLNEPTSIPARVLRGKKDLARYLRIGETMAAELLARGAIRSLKIGRARLVEIAEVERYIASLKNEQRPV